MNKEQLLELIEKTVNEELKKINEVTDLDHLNDVSIKRTLIGKSWQNLLFSLGDLIDLVNNFETEFPTEFRASHPANYEDTKQKLQSIVTTLGQIKGTIGTLTQLEYSHDITPTPKIKFR